MNYLPNLLSRNSGYTSTPAPARTDSSAQAKEREVSPISDIAEDDAIAAANIENALQTVQAAKAFMEAAAAETGAGLLKMEAKRSAKGDEGMPQATQDREEGEVDEEVDQLTGEVLGNGVEKKEESGRGIRESVPSPPPFPHSVGDGEERTAAASISEQTLQAQQAAMNQPVVNANPAPAPASAPAAAPAPQNQDEDVEMQILSSNIPPPDPIRSPTPPPVDVVTVVIRDAHGYGTNFRCKPSTKICKLFKTFAMRYQADLNNLRFISHEGRLMPKSDPRVTVEDLGLQDMDEIDVMLEQIGGEA